MTLSNSTDSSAPEIDQLGRYRLLAQLGQGGMGTIHLAVASGLGEFRKLLVVKELQRELAQNPSFVEMFMAEAKLAARLNHPNIVQTLEAGEQDGRYFLSMEFLDGQPLTQLLKRAATEPAVSLGTRLAVLCDVLAGLEYAHELCDFDGMPFEIVHRDINPQNVFLTYHGQVKLVDFGIAKAVDVDTMTTAGVFKGKLGYAAPEQVRGEPVDARSDLFAIGVMLWELIAMRRFAAGPVTQQTMDRRLHGGEPRISEAVPTVEPVLAEICDRALQVDRDARFPSAAEFRKALERYLFVSGEAPALPLGALLITKFDAERKEMHRVIDAFAKRDEQYRSVVRSLTSSPSGESSSRSSDAPPPAIVVPSSTDRGDVPTQVNSFHPSNDARIAKPAPKELEPPLEWNGSLRGRRNLYPWIASAIALAIGSYVVWQSLTRPATPVPAAAASPSLPPSAPNPPASLDPPPEPAAPVDVQAAPVTPAQTAVAAQAPPTRTPITTTTTSATRTASAADARPARSERTRRDASTELPSAGSMQPRAATTSSGSPAATGPGAPAHTSSRSNEAKADKSPAGQASARTPIVIGQDLRELPKASRRPIDLEDPFR